MPDFKDNKNRDSTGGAITVNSNAMMPVIYFGLLTNMTPLPSKTHLKSDIHKTDEQCI